MDSAGYHASKRSIDIDSGSALQGAETRPKNVAVTFCVYSGFQSAPGQTILTTLASLTDVSVGGVTAGQALVFDGVSWVASDTAVASTAEGDRIVSGTTSIIANEDRSLTFTTAGTPRMVISENGHMSFGTSLTSVNQKYYFYDEMINANRRVVRVDPFARSTVNGTHYHIGLQVTPQIAVDSGVSDAGYVYGGTINVFRRDADDAGSLGDLTGQVINAGHYQSTPSLRYTNRTTGLLIGMYADNGTIGTMYGLRVIGRNGNNVTTSYGISQEGADDRNYLAGRTGVGFGQNNPVATLDVSGTISATDAIQVGASNLTSGAGIAGAMRYTSGTMQVCNGSGWGNIGIGVPTGTIAAFAASSCPSGWTEYTASRGRFLRGIDPTGANDSVRAAGSTQVDALQNIEGSFRSISRRIFASADGAFEVGPNSTDNLPNSSSSGSSPQDVTFDASRVVRTANETRPKNVAVTFCAYSGFGSAITGAEGILWDAASKKLTIGDSVHNAVLQVNGQIVGGFGGLQTGGVLDWNDSSNARSGNGHTLLLGSASNGPGGSHYYHPFSFEYSSKDGTGNMTQFAIGYEGSGYTNGAMFLRSRYQGSWSGWHRFTTAAVSDYRAKENVREMSAGLEKVMALNPVVFDYKDGAGAKGKQDGFLAHELAQIAPYAVSGKKDQVDDAGKAQFQSIDLSRLTPLLTAAVQELKKLIDGVVAGLADLKARVNARLLELEAENATLRNELGKVKERMERLEHEAGVNAPCSAASR